MKNKIPAWLILTVICIVAAALLAATNLMTKDVIQENANREKFATLNRLMPDARNFEESQDGEKSLIIGRDGDGNAVGYSTTALTTGFGGEIEVTVAAKPDGTIGGISVGGANFSETAGLGARAREPEFQDQFAGKTAPVALTKDGGEVDALSGATITSRAVVKGVNQAMEDLAEAAGFTVEISLSSEHLGEGKYAASAQGFGGPVKVILTLDENRTITAVEIGDSEFNETPGLGARALEPDFQQQFIGKTIPLAAGDIDALAGATITTNAVMDAINTIGGDLDRGLADTPVAEPTAEEPAGPQAEEPAETAAPAGEKAPAAEQAAGKKYAATAKGFGGPVKVILTLDENRTITAIEIGDGAFNETAGLGARALEKDFQQQFIGKTIPLAAGDIDALAGATVTTNAVLQAINTIGEIGGVPDAEPAEAQPSEPAAPQAEKPAEASGPAGEKAPAAEKAAGKKYAATAKGFGGPVKVILTLDENRTITAIEIGDSAFNETPGLGAKALEEDFQQQFIGKTIPLAAGDIDALTGATVTTNAVLQAIGTIGEISGGPGAEPAEAQPSEPAAPQAEKPAEASGPAGEKAPAAEKAAGKKYAATAKGYGGPVKVILTLDENRTITAIEIGDSAFNETAGLGARALEKDFRQQFIGKTVPLAAGDIDALAGATVTTNAVLLAISTVGEISGGPDGSQAETPNTEK